MSPPNQNRKQRKPKRLNRQPRNAFSLELLQHLFRTFSCWNCSQIGHNRFQCPYPRTIACSFCRTPGVLSTECNCFFAKNHNFTPRINSLQNENNEEVQLNESFRGEREPTSPQIAAPRQNIVIQFENDMEEAQSSTEDVLELETDEDLEDS